MTIYIDELFLLNFVVDYLLLLAAARLSGAVIHRLRLAAGAALGAAYAAVVFFPALGFLLHPLCKAGAAVLMVLVGFGGCRHLLRTALVFFGVSAAFGGGILALELLGGQRLTLGVFSSALDLKLILLSAAGCYVLLSLVFRRSAQHGGQEILPAVLTLGERRIALSALVDTGNTLTDPLTNRPVMVAEGEKISPLFPAGQAPGPAALRDPVSALEHLPPGVNRRRFRLLPYQAVGVECGMLLALRVDRVKVGREDYGSILVALSPNRLTDGGGYSALIGA
ncbi:MAG: sigma-E processing peptidase SpoIIGA [Oscillospiraceae bacterium]|nr:sigma-E processing peptidase SpoIIGA [Oscillospiraceae bacterium]